MMRQPLSLLKTSGVLLALYLVTIAGLAVALWIVR